jgi:uracil-DNA glycosylase
MDAETLALIAALRQLAAAEAACTRCPLYREATQTVPGEGPSRATFMLVGEQPGDNKDLAGKPFVGPAGRMLDQALHFKHEMRGKRRRHKRPNNYEIERCKIWLDDERKLIKPAAVIALGVTAARSLTGKTLTITKVRGKPLTLVDGTKLFVTIHPSALLRTEDESDKRAAYQAFIADLKSAAAEVVAVA